MTTLPRQVALGIVLLAALPAAAQTTQGRLFFSPAERARLDAARKESLANANRPAPVKAPEQPKAAPPTVVTLNGVVKRSDGETTVWVNGKAVSERFADADIHAGTIARDAVGVDLPGSGRRVRLKVGQSVEATSGVVEDGWRRRRTLPTALVPSSAGEDTTGSRGPEGTPPRGRGPEGSGDDDGS